MGKIQTILLVGRRWFRKGVGRTYHSVEIYVNGEMVNKVPLASGYGSEYEFSARNWLIGNGYLPNPKENYYSLSTICEEKGIKFASTVTDVRRKMDL